MAANNEMDIDRVPCGSNSSSGSGPARVRLHPNGWNADDWFNVSDLNSILDMATVHTGIRAGVADTSTRPLLWHMRFVHLFLTDSAVKSTSSTFRVVFFKDSHPLHPGSWFVHRAEFAAVVLEGSGVDKALKADQPLHLLHGLHGLLNDYFTKNMASIDILAEWRRDDYAIARAYVQGLLQSSS